MSLFKLSNDIFNIGLTAKELSIYAYLCSIYSPIRDINDEAVIHVKQTTIAYNCGIGSIQTIKKVLDSLAQKNLITVRERSIKQGGHKGTYFYSIKSLSLEKGYFFVDRMYFGHLIPRQIMVYLFVCKSWDSIKNDCWNSYNDIAEQLGMKRETVINTINELAEMKFIVRLRRKSKENHRVYVDNHYQIVVYVKGKIRKKIVRLYRNYNRTVVMKNIHNNSINKYYSTAKQKSQVSKLENYIVRGSP